MLEEEVRRLLLLLICERRRLDVSFFFFSSVRVGSVLVMGPKAMAADDVETMERGGVERLEDLEPLVKGSNAVVRVASMPKAPRLASLDVFRGLSIAVWF